MNQMNFHFWDGYPHSLVFSLQLVQNKTPDIADTFIVMLG